MVFAKAPVAGTVKTRLIPLLGAEGAATLHRKLLLQTLSTAVEADLGPVELHAAPDVRDPFLIDAAKRAGVALLPQRGDDLGARMSNAFAEALARHSRVIIIGTDCPVLEPRHLGKTSAALDADHKAAFIPAEDGGYVLIALSQWDHLLFDNMRWGTDTVMADTRARLTQLKWRWHELETLWDIDRPADYRRWSELVLMHEPSRLA